MRSVDEIMEEVRRLPARDRREIAEALERELAGEQPAQDQRAAALAHWLSLAGTGHSDFSDVATDKYRHLGEAYAADE
ncbi:MAG: hypothetical protein HY996_09495 [Micrococcales bacterium]|nr:hypothetical protein [Micrococcales bacterium]